MEGQKNGVLPGTPCSCQSQGVSDAARFSDNWFHTTRKLRVLLTSTRRAQNLPRQLDAQGPAEGRQSHDYSCATPRLDQDTTHAAERPVRHDDLLAHLDKLRGIRERITGIDPVDQQPNRLELVRSHRD